MNQTAIDLRADSLERVACRLSLARLAPLLPADVKPGDLFGRFYALCRGQQYRLDNRLPVSPIPLWVVALANHAGLQVEIETGCVIGWPCPLPSWMAVDPDTGRIIRWPVNAPVEVRL